MKKSGVVFLVCFALFWTAIVGCFDGMLVYSAYKCFRSRDYVAVPGTILTSEVKESSDSEGTSYKAEIRYRYEVKGQGYEGDRLFAGTPFSAGRRPAQRWVETYPAGKTVTAYVNPADANEAILQRGFHGAELFITLFMTPFNVVMFGLWLWPWKVWREKKHPPLAGGVKVWTNGNEVRAHLNRWAPWQAGVVTVGAVAFVAIFPVGFLSGFQPPAALILPVWGMVLGAGLWAYLRRRARRNSGREDLVIEKGTLHLTLPPQDKRKQPLSLRREEVADVIVEEVPAIDSDSSPTYNPVLMLRDGRRERLMKSLGKEEAEGFVKWLRGELRIEGEAEPQFVLEGKAKTR